MSASATITRPTDRRARADADGEFQDLDATRGGRQVRGGRVTPAERYTRTGGARRSVGRHPADGRPIGRPNPITPARQASPAGTRCAAPAHPDGVYRRRRAGAAGILVGVGLAVAVWILGIVGNDYAESVTPTPAATEVTHVRQGDSLSSIAARVAPDLPRQTVIDAIVALNDLPSSGLQAGQPLLTPDYR
ncbi:LysM peptidoglycan-binding domain-containing protein [Gordonia soli]|uniref:LysM domain-containing protein n=1 Tax=Gordonia soli NBRC 108243 TaxID=1223545 RepID=M0QJY6_9ACTN|nr:LysM peptidoglycan-binding domain-containing protein [Gordonia soli]GAC68925.1 hypothetical protein GS4_19_01150 [Gordonia soli NBRC 108243]